MIGTRSSGTAAVLVGGLAVILWARCRVRRSEMRALALCKLLVRSLADPLPLGRDARSSVAVYATAHTDDNVATVADGVAELCALLPGIPTVLVHEVDNARLKPPLPNFQGSVLLRRELAARQIKPQMMQGWHDRHTTMHSLNEVEDVITHCRNAGVRALVVVSTPFHVTRSLMSALSAAARQYPELRVHAFAARPACERYWTQVAAHSQGTLVAPRSALIGSELGRIARYSAKGDLVGVESALRMLDERAARQQSHTHNICR